MAGPGGFVQSGMFAWPSQNGRLHYYQDGTAAFSGTQTGTIGQWPLYQHDESRTGSQSSALDPALTVEQWAINGGGDVRPPVISSPDVPGGNGAYPDGVAFFTAGRYLNVLDLRTHLIVKRWDLGSTSGVSGYVSPALLQLDPVSNMPDGNAANDDLWAVVADKLGVVRAYGWDADLGDWRGTPFWMVDVGSNASNASPLAGRSNLVYVMEDVPSTPDRLHAIHQDNGSLLWSTVLGSGTGKVNPVYYDGSTDYVITGADKVYWVNAATGVINPGFSCTLNGSPVALTLIDPNVIAGDGDEILYALTSTGRLYAIDAEQGCGVSGFFSELATAVGTPNQNRLAVYRTLAGDVWHIVFGTGNRFYRVTYNVAGQSHNPASFVMLGSLSTNFSSSTPVIDENGNAYIGGADGKLYSVDILSLSPLGPAYDAVTGFGWPKPLGAGTSTQSAAGGLALDDDGYVYVPSLDDHLRRYGVAEPLACADCRLYTEAPWPMFQHDPQHTGHSAVLEDRGSALPVLSWTSPHTSPAVPPRTPVVGPETLLYPDGVMYYTAGRYVIARNIDTGSELWRYDLGLAGAPSGSASPALMLVDDAANGCIDETTCSDDTVWVIVGALDGNLYALNAYAETTIGEMVWKIDLGLDISKASPTISADGTIYIVEDAALDRLHAVRWNGTRLWTRNLAAGTGTSSPALWDGPSDDWVIVASASRIFIFKAESGDAAPNATLSGKPTPANVVINNTPLIVHDDVFILNGSGQLYYFSVTLDDPDLSSGIYGPQTAAGVPTGAVAAGVAPAVVEDLIIWTGPGPSDFEFYDMIVWGGGSNLYRFFWDSEANIVPFSDRYNFFAAKPDGISSWGTLGNSSVVIDANGWMYAQNTIGYLHSVHRYFYWPNLSNSDLSDDAGFSFLVFRKKLSTSGTLVGGVVIGNDGAIFLPSRNNTLYMLENPED
jgi:hypothetical protein